MTTAVYFSATDTTKRISEAVASHVSEGFTSINLTRKNCVLSFDQEDTVIVGVPVYAGRVPTIAAERLAYISGNGSKCVALVVYGNRDYDDALLELCDILSARGFNIVSAGAFIAEHCIFPKVGNGRPDREDMAEIQKFAQLSSAKSTNLELSKIKGNRPYKKPTRIPLHPSLDKRLCNSCGACAAECPTGAIDTDNPSNTDKDKCITCCRCIHICPHNARKLSGLLYKLAGNKFIKANLSRRSPEWFI